MKILTLNTGLFPDGGTVEAAISEMGADHELHSLDLPGDKADEAAWDAALTEILAADMIITT